MGWGSVYEVPCSRLAPLDVLSLPFDSSCLRSISSRCVAAGYWVRASTPFDVFALLVNLISSRSISSPLCGAAVTFFAAAKKVTKESSFSVIQCQDVTTLESSRVARPSECPPLFVVRIGTRTHCALATPTFVVRQSSLRPRFAPTHGAPQPLASFLCVYRGASPCRGTCSPPDLPFVGHAVPRRMNDCLTTPFKGAMTQWVRVPIRSTYRDGHSCGRATLKSSNVVTS